MADPYLLYDYPLSFSAQIVRLALAEKGLDWRTKVVDIGPMHENYEPWFADVHPKMVVPVLACGEAVVTDCVEIARFLDAHHPDPPLFGTNDEERALVEDWLRRQQAFPERDLTYGALRGIPGFVARAGVSRRRDILVKHRERNRTDEGLHRAYTEKIADVEEWERKVHDADYLAAVMSRLEGMLNDLDAHLDGRTWIAGETWSLADIAWTVLLARVEFVGRASDWGEGRRPNVASYVERTRARPSFARAVVHLRPAVGVILPSMVRAHWPRVLAVAAIVLLALNYLLHGG